MMKRLSGLGLTILFFIGGISSTAVAQESPQTSLDAPYQVLGNQDFRWVGLDADMVGDGGTPDGMKDGHFQLILNLPEPMVVSRITLYLSNETGTMAVQPYIWDSDPSTSWGFLGIFYNGTLINNKPMLSRLSGIVQLDLYCKDTGKFSKGNYFGVQVYLMATRATMV